MNKIRLQTITFSLLLLASVTAFQNCTKLVSYDPAAARPQEQTALFNGGNGEGYTGKPDLYVARDPANLCADGSLIRGQIERRLSEGQASYRLTRFNCAAVIPPRLIGVEKELGNDGSGNPLQVVYQSQAFERNGSLPISASFRLICTAESGLTQELPSDALSGGTSSQLAPSGLGAWVVRGCDLSGACQVRKNCFFDGAGGFIYSGDSDCLTYATPFAASAGATNTNGNGRFLPACIVAPR